MEWLSLWLKKIILLVLLAAFLDLILPNTNLQRYVKMVMGLIILVSIMSPLFSLFNLSQDELALRMSRYQQEMTDSTDSDWKSLTNRILSTQDEQAHRYVQTQMEAIIREQIKESYGVELAQVSINMEQKDQKARIASIDIIVAEPGSKSASERATPAIKPIEPVRIELGQSNRKPDQAQEASATAEEKNPLYLQIRNSVAQSWALAPKQVEVTGEQARKEN
jgi:stage III sporulation protein AF